MQNKLLTEMDEAEHKAWDALSRYKFWMFGYWAAIWIHLNRVSGANRPNPWKGLVKYARKQQRDNAAATRATGENRAIYQEEADDLDQALGALEKGGQA